MSFENGFAEPNIRKMAEANGGLAADDAGEETLLASLYGFLSDPDEFEAFFNRLDDELLRWSDGDLPLEGIDHHFACAAKIFDRIGLEHSVPDPTEQLRGKANPSWTFDKNGRLTWQNEEAAHSHDLKLNSHFSQLSEAFEFLKTCKSELSGGTSSASLRVVILPDEQSEAVQKLFLIQKSEFADKDNWLNVSYCQLDWRDHVGALLEHSFGLSRSEQDILKGVVEGKALSAIAKERDRSIETIRTQSKSLLRKTGAKSQIGLVRLFAAISLTIPDQNKAVLVQPDEQSHRCRTSIVGVSGAEKIQIDEYGSSAGYPIIMLHGLFSGTGLTERASAYIAQSGLRIIAPWRPGWSQSTQLNWSYDEAPEKYAQLLREIIDHYGFEKVALVGRYTGSIYAAAAAQKLGQRISACILLSPTPPIIDRTQLREMSGWQRVFAYAITYTPAVVPILVRGMRQFLFRQEIEKFMAGFYTSPPVDAAFSQQPDIQKLIKEQVDHSFAQGTRAHEQDLMLTGSDWRRFVTDIAAPMMILHGADNPVDPVRHIEALAKYAKAETLLKLPEEGQLFVHAEPEMVWGHIARFIRTGRVG